MKEEAEDLSIALKESFGDQVNVKFVDVTTEEMKEYPKIASILPRVRLPLTVINDEPRFHGGISAEVISDAVREMQKNQDS
ncbi:hypothetical protein IT084_06455 [Desulfallas sp. Bu1-1]|jgi:hypothetical protein|uniref:hypothetical protein n=1 Tax=Desulfallas sp. Bu1-1 TaxID=2787620 RepID=UPI0018A0FC0B|nr:hypothetical protein [Desulfallas sp. Bu1-1]MBF7082620.1 hypothetical protein [Desulfallas sp. Bu1-1]